MSFSLKETEKRTNFILYIQGKTLSDEDQYVYLALPAAKVQELQKRITTEETDITKWGVVVEHGIGFPSETLKQHMEAKHHVQHGEGFDYKAQLKKAADAHNG